MNGLGVDSVGHLLVSNVQLAGGSAVTASQTEARSARVTVAQLGNPLADWLEVAAWSLTQTEYCATVAVQLAGMSSHTAELGSACRQAVSWIEQLCLKIASDGELTDTP